MKNIFKKAKEGKYAIGQFNFSTLEQLRGILVASKGLPIILGTSEGELNYLGLEETIALVEISKRKYNSKAFLHLDHGKDVNLIKKCIDYGFSSVHFDGSHLPLEKNREYAKNIVKYAHKKGVLVEGEIESIGSKKKASLEDLKDFVDQTKVDSLAINIGNVHGIKKVKLDFKRLKEADVDAFLVLHGGSGISDRDIKKAIKLGIVKININSELRKAWKDELVKVLKKKEIKPYKLLPNCQKSIEKKVVKKIKLFGIKKQ